MKKVIKMMLAFVALMLCGGAWATTGVGEILASWNGNLENGSTITKDGVTYTMSGNAEDITNNKVTFSGGVVTITDVASSYNRQRGLMIDFPDGPQKSISVIVKYSNFSSPGSWRALLSALYTDSSSVERENIVVSPNSTTTVNVKFGASDGGNGQANGGAQNCTIYESGYLFATFDAYLKQIKVSIANDSGEFQHVVTYNNANNTSSYWPTGDAGFKGIKIAGSIGSASDFYRPRMTVSGVTICSGAISAAAAKNIIDGEQVKIVTNIGKGLDTTGAIANNQFNYGLVLPAVNGLSNGDIVKIKSITMGYCRNSNQNFPNQRHTPAMKVNGVLSSGEPITAGADSSTDQAKPEYATYYFDGAYAVVGATVPFTTCDAQGTGKDFRAAMFKNPGNDNLALRFNNATGYAPQYEIVVENIGEEMLYCYHFDNDTTNTGILGDISVTKGSSISYTDTGATGDGKGLVADGASFVKMYNANGLISNEQGWTVSLWVNMSTGNYWCNHAILWLGTNAYRIQEAGANKRVDIYPASTTDADNMGEDSGISIGDTGVWHHMAFVSDGENIKIYKDGSYVKSYGPKADHHLYGTGFAGLTGVAFGEADYDGNGTTKVDEGAVFSKALTDAEIKLLATIKAANVIGKVARIGNALYDSVQDAIDAANAVDSEDNEVTVTLLANSTDSISIDEFVTVDVSTFALSGVVSGEGTVVYRNKTSIADVGDTVFAHNGWTGKVIMNGVFDGTTDDKGYMHGITWSNFANEHSELVFTNMKGWLYNDGIPNTAITLVDYGETPAFEISNSSNNWGYNLKLKGKGTLKVNSTNTTGTSPIRLTDVSGFTGNLDVHNLTVYIGSQGGSAAGGKIIVNSGSTATIGSGKTWTSAGGVEVAGMITGSGTISGNLVLTDAAASVTVSSVSGTVTKTVESMQLKCVEHDGLKTYSLYTPVAEIVDGEETAYFETLQAALNAAQSGDAVTLLAANAESVEIPAKVTLDTNGFSVSGAITGSGTIIFSSKTILEANLTANAFTANEWAGTVWLKNIGTTSINNNDPLVSTGTLGKLGHAGTIVKMTGCRGYINENSGVNFDWTLEVEGDTTFDYGWSNRSGWGGRNHTIAALKGTGTYEGRSRQAASMNCWEVAYFTMAEDFRGSIDLGKNAAVNTADSKGKIVVIGTYEGATFNADSNGQLYVGSDASLTIASGKQVHAVKTSVKGTLAGTGTLDCNVFLADGATIDVTGNAEGDALTLEEGAILTLGSTLNLVGAKEGQVVLKGIRTRPVIESTVVKVGENFGRLVYNSTNQTLSYELVTFLHSANFEGTWTIPEATVSDVATVDGCKTRTVSGTSCISFDTGTTQTRYMTINMILDIDSVDFGSSQHACIASWTVKDVNNTSPNYVSLMMTNQKKLYIAHSGNSSGSTQTQALSGVHFLTITVDSHGAASLYIDGSNTVATSASYYWTVNQAKELIAGEMKFGICAKQNWFSINGLRFYSIEIKNSIVANPIDSTILNPFLPEDVRTLSAEAKAAIVAAGLNNEYAGGDVVVPTVTIGGQVLPLDAPEYAQLIEATKGQSIELPKVVIEGKGEVGNVLDLYDLYKLTGKTGSETYTFEKPNFTTPAQSVNPNGMTLSVALPTALNGTDGNLVLKAKSGEGVWKRIGSSKPGAAATADFSVDFADILYGSAKSATFKLDATTKVPTLPHDLVMLANAPYANNCFGWTKPSGAFDRTTGDLTVNSGALYRIVAVAKNPNNNMVTTMFDARSNWKDLGQDAVCIDWAGADSFDNGRTWTQPRIMIDVPNFADASGSGLARKECDLIDPCLGYDARINKFVVIGLTGGGLVGAGNDGSNSDLVIYDRVAEAGDHTWSNRASIRAAIGNALDAIYDGENWQSGKAYFQGPGHAVTLDCDLTKGGITIKKGTPIFAMQYCANQGVFPFAAWYDVDNNGNITTWHVTKCAGSSGPHEPSMTILDDGSFYMIAKGSGVRKAYRSVDYKTWTECNNVANYGNVQGSIIKIGSKDGVGKYVAVMPTLGAAVTGARGDITVFVGTDATNGAADDSTAPVTWVKTDTIVWPGTSTNQGYTSMYMIDEHTLGVVFEACSHIYFQAVDISAYVD